MLYLYSQYATLKKNQKKKNIGLKGLSSNNRKLMIKTKQKHLTRNIDLPKKKKNGILRFRCYKVLTQRDFLPKTCGKYN